MNSSGIKRGLAASAISALAIAGLPLLASSASAAVGDSFTVAYTGPALNGGTEGAVVTIRAKDGQITPALLNLTGTGSPAAGSEDTADQTADIAAFSGPVNDPADSAYEFITVRIETTTTTAGQTASFRLFEDDVNAGTLDASEARQTVSISTSGPLASIDLAPASQSTPQGIESGAYTVTLKDSAGRTTQLAAATDLTITPDAPVLVTETGPDTAAAGDNTITSQEIARGTDTFTANPNGSTVGPKNITVNQGAVTKTAVLNVTKAATIAQGQLDIVTAADTWNGLGNPVDSDGDNTTTYVQVDQNAITFNFDAADSEAGGNVQLAVDGTGVTFAGQDKATSTTTLDAHGNGSIPVTVDLATIQAGDSFDVDINGFTQTIVFERAREDSIDGASATYFCQIAGACTVTAVVMDQFGNPVTSGEVEASRTGRNTDTTPQRKPVGSDGTVDFTFTDAGTTGTDTVKFEYFLDQFDNTFEDTDSSTTIKYSATGQGSDYVISLDGNNTESGTYTPDDAAVIPLFDTVDSAANEDSAIAIANGEFNQAVTLSVDNGALILAPGDFDLSDGSPSVKATLNGTGDLPAGYRVIGTTSGTVTLTVTSAGRTETAPLTVSAQSDSDSARNVTLSSASSVPHGTTQITYTAVVTDAFGNPVPGVGNDWFNKQVTGPAMYQDGDVQSDANGQIDMNVRVDSDASGDVTLNVQALPGGYGQFGAQADRQHSYSSSDDGVDLPVSSDMASATTTVEGATPPPPPPPADRTPITAHLSGHNNGARPDRLKVNGPNIAAGAQVKLFKFVNGKKKLVDFSHLNKYGNHKFVVADRNGRSFAKFVARVVKTSTTWGDTTNRKRVR